LIEATRGGLAEAAQSLLHATSIGFITGFFVPRDGVAAVSALLATHGLASSVIGAIVPAVDGAERVQIS
jgi:hypothetical protein